MRQCDHPPCMTDGSVNIGDKIYCVYHAKTTSFPNVAQGRPATPRPKVTTEEEPVKRVPRRVKKESER